MTDRERIVRGCVSCTEARSAECGLEHSTRFEYLCGASVFDQFHVYRHRCGINTQCEFIGTYALTRQNIRNSANIFKSAARTSGYYTLFYIELSVPYLIGQLIIHRTVKRYFRFLFNIMQDVFKICVYFIDRIRVARMERHRDHRFDLRQIHFDHTVVICHFTRIQFGIVRTSSVNVIELFYNIIRSPDR